MIRGIKRRLTRKSTPQKNHEQQAQNRKGPNDTNDPPRSERSRRSVIQLITPVPERSNPDLLRTLDDTRTKDPHFRGSSSFFAKVETEEGETGRRSYRICTSGNGGEDIVRRGQALANGGKSNKEEGDSEEEPGEGKDPDRGLETEEQVPDDRSSKEDRASDVQLDTGLPVRTREQYNLVTGRAQHL